MDVIGHRSPPSSTLNPNAPLFVPLAYRTVEDFSDQWWTLVQSSPWFRDYWLRERFHDPQADPLFPDIHDPALPDDDLDTLFFLDDPSPEYQHYSANKHEEGEAREFINKDLVSLGVIQWQKGRVNRAQAPRYLEKAPKVVNVKKASPRTIQQPR